MRRLLVLLAVALALGLAACGGSDSGSTEAAQTTSASTGTAADTGAGTAPATGSEGAPCTKEALAEGARASFGNQEIKILDGYVCKDGWAAGPILVGPDGSEEQIEAAFMVKAENGKWVVPKKLPCDDPSVPEDVLDTSPCRVS
jgi:hypothetical protein